jgi:hypothetical protein
MPDDRVGAIFGFSLRIFHAPYPIHFFLEKIVHGHLVRYVIFHMVPFQGAYSPEMRGFRDEADGKPGYVYKMRTTEDVLSRVDRVHRVFPRTEEPLVGFRVFLPSGHGRRQMPSVRAMEETIGYALPEASFGLVETLGLLGMVRFGKRSVAMGGWNVLFHGFH